MDEIIYRGAINFIEHDEDDHQEEEENSNNDASLMSYDEQEEEGRESEDKGDFKCKLK